jgi:hypothetical protein
MSFHSRILPGEVFTWEPDPTKKEEPYIDDALLEFDHFRSHYLHPNKPFLWDLLGHTDIRILIYANDIADWLTGTVVFPTVFNEVITIHRDTHCDTWKESKASRHDKWHFGTHRILLKKRT